MPKNIICVSFFCQDMAGGCKLFPQNQFLFHIYFQILHRFDSPFKSHLFLSAFHGIITYRYNYLFMMSYSRISQEKREKNISTVLFHILTSLPRKDIMS